MRAVAAFGQGSTGQGRLELNMAEQGWPELNMAEQGWLELNMAEQGWLELNMAGQGWLELRRCKICTPSLRDGSCIFCLPAGLQRSVGCSS